jgi:hypothetical protein
VEKDLITKEVAHLIQLVQVAEAPCKDTPRNKKLLTTRAANVKRVVTTDV